MLTGFRSNVILRVIAITVLAVALGFVLIERAWFFTPVVISILLVASVINLIYYVERTNTNLTSLLLSIRQKEYTTNISSGNRGKSFTHLSKAFNDVILEFEKLNFQQETHYQYLQLLTDNVGVGIISFNPNGEVKLINPEAKRLLKVYQLGHRQLLNKIHPKLYETVINLHVGEKKLIRIIVDNRELNLSIQFKRIRLHENHYEVFLIQDLNRELDEKEVEAWQKLIRVLTHEIMNSVTPIVSLTSAVNRLLNNYDGERKELKMLSEEDAEDVYGSLQTIEARSKGLLRFINAYKDFSQTPEVTLTNVDLSKILRQSIDLMRSEVVKNNVDIKLQLSEELRVRADEPLIQQVLINLIKNSIEALSEVENGKITIETSKIENRVHVSLSDNGVGIHPDVLERVFVPFFTTKKTGTGIGLSLARQIIKLHNGSLYLKSEPGKGTIVLLELEAP
jgi:two-component system, NtrC family, nitrogen regulation sensor histidine kinase NtrY